MFAGHDSTHLYVKANASGEARREEEKGGREGRAITCAQRRGVFPPCASGTISAKLSEMSDGLFSCPF